jgi:hypothetical protein
VNREFTRYFPGEINGDLLTGVNGETPGLGWSLIAN